VTVDNAEDGTAVGGLSVVAAAVEAAVVVADIGDAAFVVVVAVDIAAADDTAESDLSGVASVAVVVGILAVVGVAVFLAGDVLGSVFVEFDSPDFAVEEGGTVVVGYYKRHGWEDLYKVEELLQFWIDLPLKVYFEIQFVYLDSLHSVEPVKLAAVVEGARLVVLLAALHL